MTNVRYQYIDINKLIQIKSLTNYIMSQREGSDYGYGSSRSGPYAEQPQRSSEIQQNQSRQPQTERGLHQQSPTKHDIEFYVRKVNRYEVEISQLENELSLARFKLTKAEDFQIKYDLLFKENQNVLFKHQSAKEQINSLKNRQQKLSIQLDHSKLTVVNLTKELETQKKNVKELNFKKEQLRSKASNDGAQEREQIKDAHFKQIDDIKRLAEQRQLKLKNEVTELKSLIAHKEIIQGAANFKLDKIKKEKNEEISRLKELTNSLKSSLCQFAKERDDKLIQARTGLIEQTESRILNVRSLANLIEQTLTEEINNLNATLRKKNNEIQFLILCDKKSIDENERTQNDLKAHIKRLQDKIFVIQRENQIELFNTIDRLKSEYEKNISDLNANFDNIRQTHNQTVQSLKTQISNLKKEIDLLNSENRTLEAKHKQLHEEKEQSITMLSQKLISMQSAKDTDLKNYTTSMRQIEDDAKANISDLHSAIANKNTEVQILQSQLAIKNEEINHLLEEISNLRGLNREKLKKLETTNAAEQNALNNEISALKKDVLSLKRNTHELQSQLTDQQAQSQLKINMMRQTLQSQKEANELLKSKNQFLVEWCQQLERDLKAERVSNVNILHDQNISKRENVQVREEVRVELQAIKDKEVEQIKNIYRLEKGRLQGELTRKQHQLRQKKEELGRLLVQYKNLEGKIGRSSKLEKGSEEEGKCKATLQAEILLTENIFNAINRP